MADMTDSAFCRVVKEVLLEVDNQQSPSTPAGSAGLRSGNKNPTSYQLQATSFPLIFREMISSEAVVRKNKKTLAMAELHPSERPIIQQIFGGDPEVMAKAAREIEETFYLDGIDINMGCPVYKIVSNFNGAALMKEPARAAQIVRAVKAVVSVPVSVKIRLGWNDPNECVAFAKVLEASGADAIEVHARTKMQGYSGKANWAQVAKIKRVVSIPVLVNGDIVSGATALEALEKSGADGVLIGRGALGNPWIFLEIKQAIKDMSDRSYKTYRTYQPLAERLHVIRRHLELHCEQYGERGVVTFRKHLGWYFRGLPHAKEIRERLFAAKTREELIAALDRGDDP